MFYMSYILAPNKEMLTPLRFAYARTGFAYAHILSYTEGRGQGKKTKRSPVKATRPFFSTVTVWAAGRRHLELAEELK